MDSGDGSGIRKHLTTHPEAVDGSGSRNDVSESSRLSTTQPKVIDGSGSSQPLVTRPEATAGEGGQPTPAKKSEFSCSFSSSSIVEDIFQVNTKEVLNSRAETTASPKPDDNAKLAKIDSDNSSSKSEEADNGSNCLRSSSQVSDVTHESIVFNGMSPTQSPPRQVMERSDDYDPFRIPSSVFSTNATSPVEWSIASNESLFSIHVGNNSFSRDHLLLLAGEVRKSEELTKSDELIMLSPPLLVSVGETDRKTDRKSVDQGSNFGETGVADEPVKDSTKAITDAQINEKLPRASCNSSSLSHRSDGSANSTRSFAFPIKKKCACSCAWPFRYCSNCSWAFCYCRWPRCYCSNCSWAFCYRWNCRRKRLCCFSSSVLTEGGVKNGSMKVADAAEQQHLQTPSTHDLTPKFSTKRRGLSCFPCPPCPPCRPCPPCPPCRPCPRCPSCHPCPPCSRPSWCCSCSCC